MKRIIFAKGSGELLNGSDNGDSWTPNGTRQVAEKYARLVEHGSSLGIMGLVVVSGAGNVVRGDELRKHGIAHRHADTIGRLATLQNQLVISDALAMAGVGSEIFIPSSNSFGDINTGELREYNPDHVRKLICSGCVALVAFGKGTDGDTTDAAVMHWAAVQRSSGDNVVVLKGTKTDGVYDGDPKLNLSAKKFSTIKASDMLANYDNFKVVDKRSLEIMIESGIGMKVYADGQHDMEQAINPDSNIGTSILPE